MVLLKLDERLLAAHLHDSIEYFREGTSLVLTLSEGENVQHTLDKNHIILSQPVIAIINEQTADFTQILEDGDRVRLLPQIAGGSTQTWKQ
ncbi:MAG: MoaD/ThiS family protein [Anaerolineales bacterium]|nr:MoaD/ThiS family protein [Anaerolineales bacterium]